MGNSNTIWRAAASGDLDKLAVKILKHSYEIDMRDANGWTALHHAAKNGHFDAVELLVDSGADANLRTGNSKNVKEELREKKASQLNLNMDKDLQEYLSCRENNRS